MSSKKPIPGRLYNIPTGEYMLSEIHGVWEWSKFGDPDAPVLFIEIVEINAISYKSKKWRLAKCLYNEKIHHFASWNYLKKRFDLPYLKPMEDLGCKGCEECDGR